VRKIKGLRRDRDLTGTGPNCDRRKRKSDAEVACWPSERRYGHHATGERGPCDAGPHLQALAPTPNDLFVPEGKPLTQSGRTAGLRGLLRPRILTHAELTWPPV